MKTPTVAAIHDISGFGRCSLTVALPVISAMGVQCSVLPTAYLSTHTGGFEGYTFLDMTEEMKKAMKHWQALGLRFDAVYSGFLGSEEQIDLVSEFIRTFRAAGGVAIVDPVMGDNGQRYVTYTDAMCSGVERLIQNADIITPNITEAAFLLHMPYDAMPTEQAGFCQLAKQLSGGGARSVVVTGATNESGDLIGAAYYDRTDDSMGVALTRRAPGLYHGTGDIFASVLTGATVRGARLCQATKQAVEFLGECTARTYPLDAPRREGVDFEPLLWKLHSCEE